jgi:oligopeptide/dipeptide ABC transporter ATP-binding protein
MSLLEITDLAVRFRVPDGQLRVVDGISFAIEAGEAVGLVGESGCGKTTVARAIIGRLPENGRIVGGSIRLDGEELVGMREAQLRRRRWRDVSLIFQGAMNALNPVIRVGDQVVEPILQHEAVTPKQARARAAELFERVGISANRMRDYPHEFSGGMRQRVVIAMALANRPKLLIGDEPTTALDVMVQAQILDLLESLRRELGLSLLLISHDLSVVAETCDRAVVMYAGRVVESGPIDKALSRPLHPYTEKLMASTPDVHGERTIGRSIPGVVPQLIAPPVGCRFNPRCDRAMTVCLDIDPPERAFQDHRVFCHAVSDDGRLPSPRDLPVLDHALRVALAESQDMELVE